jgi:TldD protein
MVFSGRLLLLLLSLSTKAVVYSSSQTSPPIVLSAAKMELTRSFSELKKQKVAPYFLSYEIRETRGVDVGGSFGALLHSGESHNRQLLVDLHVGDHNLDNTREVRGNPMAYFQSRYSNAAVPVEDDVDAIRAALWHETDSKYKQAVEKLTTVKTNTELKVDQEDKSADFSSETPEHEIDPVMELKVDRKAWEEKVRKYTAPFQRFGNLYQADANFTADTETRWFVSSDGAEIRLRRRPTVCF